MRILVFGGSFDPVHLGHEAVADAARAALAPDRLLWLPSGQAPHKLHRAAAPAAAREAFLRLVLVNRPGEELDLRELQRPGPSYTVDSLRSLAAECPGAALFFLLGADSLEHLASWRDPAGLFGCAEFVFAPRPGWEPSHLEEFRRELAPALRALFRARWLPMRLSDAGSTAIRAEIARGAEPTGLRPAVLAEIRRRGCYR